MPFAPAGLLARGRGQKARPDPRVSFIRQRNQPAHARHRQPHLLRQLRHRDAAFAIRRTQRLLARGACRQPLRQGQRGAFLRARHIGFALQPGQRQRVQLGLHATDEVFRPQVDLLPPCPRPQRLADARFHPVRPAPADTLCATHAQHPCMHLGRVQPAGYQRQPDVRAVAAPRPVGRLGHDAGAHRVQFDIAAQRQQIAFAVHHDGVEAPLEHMPHANVAAVERLRVHAVQVPHEARQVRLPRLQHQVIVVAHQAIGQHAGIEAVDSSPQNRQQPMAVGVVGEDLFAPVATRRHVIDGTGELDAQWAGHGGRQSCLGVKNRKTSLRGSPWGWTTMGGLNTECGVRSCLLRPHRILPQKCPGSVSPPRDRRRCLNLPRPGNRKLDAAVPCAIPAPQPALSANPTQGPDRFDTVDRANSSEIEASLPDTASAETAQSFCAWLDVLMAERTDLGQVSLRSLHHQAKGKT